jgi:ribosome-binding protein aMBF1 (putative translation factor)
MSKRTHPPIDCRRLELDGVRYVVVRESVFDALCQKARVQSGSIAEHEKPDGGLGLDSVSLAEKLVRRRRAAGLSQADLARRAGVRPETLNRIERGHTTPDFATVRKLVVAMNAAESETASKSLK